MTKSSHDLSKSSLTKHSTNILDAEKKPSSTFIQTVTTDTPTASSTSATSNISPLTRTDSPKTTSSTALQPPDKANDGRSLIGQNTSNVVSIKSANKGIKESHEINRDTDVFSAPGQTPKPTRVKSGRDTHPSARVSRMDVFETPPSFDSEPKSQEVMQGEKVTFTCQGQSY